MNAFTNLKCIQDIDSHIDFDFNAFTNLKWIQDIDSHIEANYSTKQEKERKILTSFKRPKWPIRPNKILHRKCCLVFENNKSK